MTTYPSGDVARNYQRQYLALSVFLGFDLVIWGLSGSWHTQSSIHDWQRIAERFLGVQLWLNLMMCVGVYQIVTTNLRHHRHIGLILATSIWTAVWAMFVIVPGTMPPVAYLPLSHALFSAWAYADEVYSKIKYNKGASHDFFAR